MQAVTATVQIAGEVLAAENLASEQRIRVITWASDIQGYLDGLDSARTAYLNAVDRAQTISGQLRDARNSGRSSLAQALFLSSDAAGRQFASNTVMRNLYDINLQRYEESLRAAIRSAATARLAIEQRFGVDLETQQCAQLVDSPSSWANDICTATGVDYGALRNPDVDFDEARVRGMFIGDYVRRLEQYVESYRYDYPYQSGDDVTVVSLRDDVVRARSSCVSEVENWIGSSNDLLAAVLPAADGSTVADPANPTSNLSIVPEPAWLPHGCAGEAPYENCVAVTPVEGPRLQLSPAALFAERVVAPPVYARAAGHAPRGFEVRFAPRIAEPYVGDYQNGASYAQAVVLPAGLYRLSWYQVGAAWGPPVDVADATGQIGSESIEYGAHDLASGWKRYYRMVEIPPSSAPEVFLVGVFAGEAVAVVEQVTQVAGLQLERVSGTPTETAWRGGGWPTLYASPLDYGPSLFASTTTPGYGHVDDCIVGDLAAFRREWRYDCAQLCAGGLSGHCDPGEVAQQFCYWAVGFNLTEDRMLARGGSFGGGFAVGNYNYRSGDIAVNVVGTGVRNCERGGGSEVCYSTGTIPFSILHTAPAADAIGGGSYSVRAHDGSLHSVDLFDGRVETGRALAAERFLTNPVSSTDASLLGEFARRELRGRPMTGNYRLLIWDDGTVDFGSIEDVQLLWRYRYFTRTGSAYTCH